MTKDEIRQKVRTRLQLAGVARFPGLEGRIPNFTGADQAAQLLCELPMWKRAKVISVNCDPPQQAIRRATPATLSGTEFAAGSMLPKVIAASDFAAATGKPAAIGALSDIDAMLDGTAGTRVTTSISGVEFASS